MQIVRQGGGTFWCTLYLSMWASSECFVEYSSLSYACRKPQTGQTLKYAEFLDLCLAVCSVKQVDIFDPRLTSAYTAARHNQRAIKIRPVLTQSLPNKLRSTTMDTNKYSPIDGLTARFLFEPFDTRLFLGKGD